MAGLKKVFPLMDFPDRAAHIMRGGLFEQKSHRARPDGVGDIGVVTVRGEHEHFGGGQFLANLPGGLQAVEQRHGDIHQHYVRAKVFGHRNGLPAVLCFADHFEVGLQFEHLAQSLPHNRMIFGQHYSDTFHKNSRLGFSGLR